MAIPVAIAYSPKTRTNGITLIGATTIVINNTVNEGIESFPVASVEAPGVAVMCTSEHFNSEDPADYETITYTERDVPTNELRGVTRNVEGTAREWPDETWIASFVTADAWNEMRAEVNTNKADIGINVKDFGAVGDGVADDTTAISNALNSSTHGKFYFPEGTYKVTSQISIDGDQRNIHIYGHSHKTTTITGDFTGDLFVFTGTHYYGSCTIEELKFTKAAGNPGILIRIMGGRKHRIKECHFVSEVTTGAGSYCILSYGPFTEIMNNLFYHSTSDSYTVVLLSGAHLTFKSHIGSSIVDNHFTSPDPGATPVFIGAASGANQAEGIVIKNNQMVTFSLYAIYIGEAIAVYISNNIMDQPSSITIWIDGPASQISITNNYISTAQAPTTGIGIYMSDVKACENITIANNDISLSNNGIHLNSTSHKIIITGNRFFTLDGSGIMATGAGDIIVNSNYFDSCGAGITLASIQAGFKYIIMSNIFKSSTNNIATNAAIIEEHNHEY